MSASIGERFGLGPIDQVAYVVENLDEALPRYESIFGAFEVADSPLQECLYRGRTVDTHLKLAVNRTGPLEIELIEVAGGEAPHSEHLKTHGEGLHHVRFRVDDLDATLSALADDGFEVIFEKRFAPTVGFAYVETPPEIGGSVIELLQLP